MSQQTEKTRDVSLWINGSMMIEVEKINDNLFKVFISVNGSTIDRCAYWQKSTVETMKGSGFLQRVD